MADRVALRELEKILRDCYDSIHCIWSVAELTKREERCPVHLEMIQVDKYLPLLDSAEDLIAQVVFVGDLHFNEEQTKEVNRLIAEIREHQMIFREAFYEARSKYMEELQSEELADNIQEMQVVHTVACHMMMIANGFIRYAEKALAQTCEVSYLCDMEGFGFRSLFEGVRYSMRVIISVLLGFFTGFTGLGMVDPGTPAIAKATATLLSKFPGSALVKNLNRIQGVVLGTVFGQLLDTIFHRSAVCSCWNEILLGCCFASYIFATVFIHFYVTDFAILGIQMANFGGTEPWQKRSRGRLFLAWQDRPGMETGGEGKYDKTNFHWWLIWRVGRDTQEMMTGECGEKENTGKAYSKIIINLLAIIFIVLVDLVFASERASETWYSLEMELCSERWSMGCLNKESPGKLVSKVWTLSQEVWSTIKHNVLNVFDPDQKVIFSNLDLDTQIAKLESLGREASYEPRYHRTDPWTAQAWRDEMFTTTLKEMRDIRYSLSTLERILADHGCDGAQKADYFRSGVLHSSAIKKWASILCEKFDVISSLLEVFSHESTLRWTVLDDEKVTKQFRDESHKAKKDLLQERGRLNGDDPLCMLSIFLACTDAMLLSMRKMQHHILRLY
eukprot:g30455.t1